MKKLISCLLLICLLCLSLASCGGSGDTPPGMKLLSNEARDGMLLYVPEQYTLFYDETSGVMLATLSRLDPTSISGYTVYPSEGEISEYVAAHFDLAELGEDAVLEADYPAVLEIDGREAPTYVYSFRRGETDYRAMQVYIPRDPENLSLGVAVLTYTARMTESVTGLVAYTEHLEDFQKTLQVFSFGEKGESVSPEAPTPTDGMILASDPAITNYRLYVPESYTLDLKIGITSAYDAADRTSVTAFYCYPDGVQSVQEYVNERLTKYLTLFDTCEKVIPSDAALKDESDPSLGKNEYVALTVDGFPAFRYEFSATLDGVSFRFAEVLILRDKGLTKTGLYTVTMTANGADAAEAEARLDAHRTELAAMLDAFRFD